MAGDRFAGYDADPKIPDDRGGDYDAGRLPFALCRVAFAYEWWGRIVRMKLVWLCVAACILVVVGRALTSPANDEHASAAPMVAHPALPLDSARKEQLAAHGRQTLLDAQAEATDDKAAVDRKMAHSFPPYEKTVGMMARKIGTVNAIAQCNLRPTEWYGPTVARLETQLNQMYFDLPPADRRGAEIYARKEALAATDFALGGKYQAGCPALAAMPFVLSDAFLDR